MTSGKMTERDLICRIHERIHHVDADVVRGIGDDCAVLRRDHSILELMTTDTLVESVHFDMSWHPPKLLGRKAVSVNISDIAAMGGVPRFALLSLAIPPTVTSKWLDLFLEGFFEALEERDVQLIGGDTVKSGQETMITVTAVGEVNEREILYRSGAEVGDTVWVGGHLGEAAAGLALCRQGVLASNKKWRKLLKAHLDPVSQVELGRVLTQSGLVHAMMDISDGLATDLAHICTESKVGAEIDAADIPIGEATAQAADHCRQPALDWALKGGEDYQLLFACAEKNGPALQQLVKEKTGLDIFRAGRIVKGSGVTLFEEGKRIDITYQGYEHFR